jgi:hypothetical protein
MPAAFNVTTNSWGQTTSFFINEILLPDSSGYKLSTALPNYLNFARDTAVRVFHYLSSQDSMGNGTWYRFN